MRGERFGVAPATERARLRSGTMRIAFFSSHAFERTAFEDANRAHRHEITFLDARLTESTASLASGAAAVCCFATDRLDAPTLGRLSELNVRSVLLRSAGFDHVDLEAAARVAMPILRVPAYSPHAVAEHAFALLLGLIRKIPRAWSRVRDGNFSLDGLVGIVLEGRTFGVLGTGNIGASAARIAHGFGCRVLAHDIAPDRALSEETGAEYVSFAELLRSSDILSLHVPLTPKTRHIIDPAALARMKPDAILINTARGGLIDSAALVEALTDGRLGGAGLDVYEGEGGLFFQDHSGEIIRDPLWVRLLALPNVLVTAHQGFLTREALANIAQTTLENASAVESGRRPLPNQVAVGGAKPPRA